MSSLIQSGDPARARLERLIRAILVPYLALLFLATAWVAWQGVSENHPWRIGDWLINYQGGFVRRGLSGELTLLLSASSGIDPGFWIWSVQLACYLAFFGFSASLLTKQASLQPYLWLLFSPFLFAFQLHDHVGGYRKEVVHLAALAFVAWSAQRHDKRTFGIVAGAVLLLYPLAIMSHELIAVYLPYVVVLFLLRLGTSLRTLAVTSLLLLPSIAAFGSALLHPGTEEHVAAICESLGQHAPQDCTSDGAIAALRRTPAFWMEAVRVRIATQNFLEIYAFVLGMSLLAFLPIRRNLIPFRSGWSLALLLASAVGTCALFFVALDWGRFLYIHFVSLFLLSLAGIGGGTSESKASVQESGLDRPPRSASWDLARYAALLASLGIYAGLWHIPNSFGRPFMSAELRRLLRILLTGWL